MSASLKDFAALGSLRQQLQEREEARRRAEAERRQREEAARQEAELFQRSVGTVAPLTAAERVQTPPPRPLPVARQRIADEAAALQESISDEFTPDTLLATDGELSFARDGIGLDTVRKLRRGHWVVQAQLDLHGLRRDEAREALAEFIRQATRRGLRCVRVIHGKGLGSVNKEPVLKGRVRNWLAQKKEVLAFCQARAADGGSGALMVLLKAQG